MSLAFASRIVSTALLLMPLPSVAAEPGAPATDGTVAAAPTTPIEEAAGAATLESNRAAMARTVADTAAIAAYQEQLVQFRAQQAQYQEQAAEAERQAAAYRAAQAQYAAQLAAMKSNPEAPPRPESRNPKDDVVTCEDVMMTGSRTRHRECHTRREWRQLQ